MFNNTVKTEWLKGKRDMKLIESLSFKDSKGVIWTAPKGSIIDGASIPRFFWRVIGAPLSGIYRRASVLHDVYCASKSRPHKQVHKMFYEAMLVDDVPKIKAKTMYRAVRMFGPKW